MAEIENDPAFVELTLWWEGRAVSVSQEAGR